MQSRQQQFYDREESILKTAEQLLLDASDGDLTLDDLAEELDIAKGTLYKHFSSKDELYLQILIRYEKKLAIANAIEDDPSAGIARMVLQILLFPKRAMLFNYLEEKLAGTSTGLGRLFGELYKIRRERMNLLLNIAERYLAQKQSTLSTRDYLSTIWAMGQGGATLLNSTFYQRYLGRRDTLILSLVTQVLDLPLLYTDKKPQATPKTTPAPTPNPPKTDDFSPFGKLSPPSL